MIDLETFSFAPGFRATATAAGLKKNGALDMALVAAESACSAAGVFTTNRVKAAPVRYDMALLQQGAAGVRAMVINAGNANAVTGPQGDADCLRMAELTAYGLRCQPDQVLVLSTGVIGRQLDMAKVTQGIAELTSSVASVGAHHAALAIMTTDTRPKTASATVAIDGVSVTIAGMCKGAGMIHPNMATMLAVVTTDAAVAPPLLDAALRRAADRSFNRISVDGDTSTNDTLLLLASGASGLTIDGGAALDAFGETLAAVCTDLAKQVARDGEGATRLVELRVLGAVDEAMAHTVGNAIAKSPLVKTAIHGFDPNWGRILCATGYSGAAIDPETITLTFGAGEDSIVLLDRGVPTPADLAAASALLRRDPVHIAVDLGLGAATTTMWFCDFSKEYVEINAHYTT